MSDDERILSTEITRHDTTPPPTLAPYSDLSDGDLAKYSLPPRPDRGSAPQAYANWLRALSSPTTFVQTQRWSIEIRRFPQILLLGNKAATQDTSHNWSGGYVRQYAAGSYSLIQGYWSVPSVGSGRRPPSPVPGLWKSSTWIGLDGYYAASRSMPQIGTEQRLDDTANGLIPQYSAWLWWWTSGEIPQQAPPLPLPVEPGNFMFAQISVLDPTHVTMLLNNVSKKQAVSYTIEAPKRMLLGSQVTFPIEGRTAQWIVERPLDPTMRRNYTMPDYGATSFTGCNVVSTETGGNTEQQLEDGHLIRLADWDDPQVPGTIVSSATFLGQDSIKATYTGR